MLKHRNQPEITAQAPGLPDAEIDFLPEYLSAAAADKLFDQLLRQIEWRQEQITLFGKTHRVPRLSCWMADAGLAYSYSNMTMQPVAWLDCVQQLRTRIERDSGHHFNSVLLNYYRDGQDANGWHSDDEPELGPAPLIASLSLGAPRRFRLRHKSGRGSVGVTLGHGSLLLMAGATQRHWQHAVPKTRRPVAPRVNLTFRHIKTQ